jgi:hypothetical protein
MRSTFLVVLLAGLFAAAPTASAQTEDLSSETGCIAAWDKREYSPVKGIEPTVSVMRAGSLTRDCDVISVYFRWSNWDRDYPAVAAGMKGTAYHFARLTKVRSGVASEQWADSRACPALASAIASLAKLTPPPISIPGHVSPTDKPITIQLDGDSFSLSNRLGPEFRGNQASPLGVWTYAALKDLEDCWTPTAPSLG